MDESGEKQAAEWQELDLSMRPVRESSLSAPAVTAILDQIDDDKREGLSEKLNQIAGHTEIPDSGSGGSVNIQLFALTAEVMAGFKDIILPLVLSKTMLTMKIYARESSSGGNDLIVKALKVTELDLGSSKKSNAVNVAFEDELVIRILCFYEKIRSNLEKEKSLDDVRALISTRRSKVDDNLMRQLKQKYQRDIPTKAEAEEFFKDESAAFGSNNYCFDLTNTAALQTKKKWWSFGSEGASASAATANVDTPGGAVAAATHAKLESANFRLKSENEVLKENVKDLKVEMENFKEESAKTAKALSVQHHNAVRALNKQLRQTKEAHAIEVKSLTEKLQRWARAADEEAAISAQLKTDMKNAKKELGGLETKCLSLTAELDGKDEQCNQAVEDAKTMSKIANKRSLSAVKEMKSQLAKLLHKHTELIKKYDALVDVIVSSNGIRSAKTGAVVKLLPMPDLTDYPEIQKRCEDLIQSKENAVASEEPVKATIPPPRPETNVKFAVEVVLGAAADLYDKAAEENQPSPSYVTVKTTLINRFGENTFKEHKAAIQHFLQEKAGAPAPLKSMTATATSPPPSSSPSSVAGSTAEHDYTAEVDAALNDKNTVMKKVLTSGAGALKRFGDFLDKVNTVPPRRSSGAQQRPPTITRRVLKLGDAVVIQGLKGKKHFNGKRAVIKRKYQGGKFFEVEILDPKTSIRVFPSNLKLVVTETPGVTTAQSHAVATPGVTNQPNAIATPGVTNQPNVMANRVENANGHHATASVPAISTKIAQKTTTTTSKTATADLKKKIVPSENVPSAAPVTAHTSGALDEGDSLDKNLDTKSDDEDENEDVEHEDDDEEEEDSDDIDDLL